jgi:hypothetical protein
MQSVLLFLIGILAVFYIIKKLPSSNCNNDCSQGRNCNCDN